MKFDVSQVRAAFRESYELAESEIALPVWDAHGPTGVGIDSKGRAVLVLRPCDLSVGLNSRHFAFRPDTSVSIQNLGLIERASVLFVDQEATGEFDADAVATIFLGLIEVSSDKNVVLSDVIDGLTELFENGRFAAISTHEQIGLAGELLVIRQAKDLDLAVRCWRSGDRDRFDFSNHSERVEIKTTTGRQRVHNFSDGQIPGPADCQVVVGSVLLQRVEEGTTISDLIAEIWNRLTTAASKADLIKKAGVVMGSSTRQTDLVHFDSGSSMNSILFMSANDVPKPVQRPGVLSMTWSALLVEEEKHLAGGALISVLCPNHRT